MKKCVLTKLAAGILLITLCFSAFACDKKKDESSENEKEIGVDYSGEYEVITVGLKATVDVKGKDVTFGSEIEQSVDGVPGVVVKMLTRQTGKAEFDDEKSKMSVFFDTMEMTIRIDGDAEVRNSVLSTFSEAQKACTDEETYAVLEAYIEAIRDEKYVDAARFGEEVPEAEGFVFELDREKMTALPISSEDGFMDGNGKLIRVDKTTYNKDGQESKIVSYDDNGKVIETTTYEYFDSGVLKRSVTENEEGTTSVFYEETGLPKSVLVCDLNRAKKEEATYEYGILRHDVIYGKTGRVVQEFYYSTDGSLYEYFEYFEDPHYIKVQKRFDALGWMEYLHDETGRIIREIWYDSEGNLIQDVEYPAQQ